MKASYNFSCPSDRNYGCPNEHLCRLQHTHTYFDVSNITEHTKFVHSCSSPSPSREMMTGQDRTGQDRTGQDRTGQDRTGQDRTGQDRTGQDRTGQDRTGQDRTGQDRTGQDRTGHFPKSGWGHHFPK